MSFVWRVMGAMCAGMAGFVGLFAVAFAVTGGSAWMLAFLPLFPAVMAAPIILILRPMFHEDDE